MNASSEKKRREEARLAKLEKKAALQREAEEKAKKSRLKWRLTMAGIAVFVILCLVLNSALPYRMNAVKVGETDYSAAEMNYYYYNAYYQYAEYMNMFGVDFTDPEWVEYRLFDFNSSGNIDIYDICYVAKLV